MILSWLKGVKLAFFAFFLFSFSYFSDCCYIFIWIKSYVFSKFPFKTKAILQRKVLIKIEMKLIWFSVTSFSWAIDRMQLILSVKFRQKIQENVEFVFDRPKFCMTYEQSHVLYVGFFVNNNNSAVNLLNLVVVVFLVLLCFVWPMSSRGQPVVLNLWFYLKFMI